LATFKILKNSAPLSAISGKHQFVNHNVLTESSRFVQLL